MLLGISQAARRARWISAFDAAEFAVRTAACFLPRGRDPGLLAALRSHCTEEPLRESYSVHLESGRLLAEFVDALTSGGTGGFKHVLLRSSMLARLRRERGLVCQLDESGLEALTTALPDRPDWLCRLARARIIAAATEELELIMEQQRANLLRRVGSFGTQPRPDVFWSAAEGWTLDRATTPVLTSGVGWGLASHDPKVRAKAEAVMQAWSVTGLLDA
jgi:hypothetical protein